MPQICITIDPATLEQLRILLLGIVGSLMRGGFGFANRPIGESFDWKKTLQQLLTGVISGGVGAAVAPGAPQLGSLMDLTVFAAGAFGKDAAKLVRKRPNKQRKKRRKK